MAFVWVALAALKTWMALQGDPRYQPAMTLLHKAVVGGGRLVMWYGIDPAVRVLMRQRWFMWLTGFAFMIYALHVPLINYAMIWIFPKVAHVPHYRLWVYVALPTADTAFCVLTGAAPGARMYGALTGEGED